MSELSPWDPGTRQGPEWVDDRRRTWFVERRMRSDQRSRPAILVITTKHRKVAYHEVVVELGSVVAGRSPPAEVGSLMRR
jgi:hypothetical protein